MTHYVAEIPYSEITPTQERNSVAGHKDSMPRSIRDDDTVLCQYRVDKLVYFKQYPVLKTSVDELKLGPNYANIGLDTSSLFEIRSSDIELSGDSNFSGEITDVIIRSGGTGYADGGSLSVDDDNGSGFEAVYSVDESGTITSVDIINSGSGYLSPPSLVSTIGYTQEADLVAVLSTYAGSSNKLVLPLDIPFLDVYKQNDAIIVETDKKLAFSDVGEYISGNGTDLTIGSGSDINLTATSDINIPANIGLIFGDDGEKIEGDGTDLTIASSGDIWVKSNDLTLDVDGDITLDADGSDVLIKNDDSLGFQFRTITGTGSYLNIFERGGTTENDYCQIKVEEHGATTIATIDAAASAANLSFDIDGDILMETGTVDSITLKPGWIGPGVLVDMDDTYNYSLSQSVLKIDYDKTGLVAAANISAPIGLEIDMNCETVSHAGTVNQTGIDIDMLVGTNGTQTNTGMDIKCTGGNDNNYGLNITVPDVAGDYHMKLMSADNTTDYATIAVAAAGATTLTTVDTTVGMTAHLTLDVDGDIILDSAGEQIYFDNATTRFGSIDMASASTLKLIGETDYKIQIISQGAGDINLGSADNIIIDATDALIFDSDGTYIMRQDGVEYSVANSAYAGMILGYRMIGEDAIHTSYTFTTSYAVPDSDMTVRFEAPPSGAVEVTVQFYMDGTSGRYNYIGLSDNATYNSIGNSYEQSLSMADETDFYTMQHIWVVTGLTAGDTYNYWMGVKSSHASGYIRWGGTPSLRYPDFIMKVVALPTAVSDYAEYD